MKWLEYEMTGIRYHERDSKQQNQYRKPVSKENVCAHEEEKGFVQLKTLVSSNRYQS